MDMRDSPWTTEVLHQFYTTFTPVLHHFLQGQTRRCSDVRHLWLKKFGHKWIWGILHGLLKSYTSFTPVLHHFLQEQTRRCSDVRHLWLKNFGHKCIWGILHGLLKSYTSFTPLLHHFYTTYTKDNSDVAVTSYDYDGHNSSINGVEGFFIG